MKIKSTIIVLLVVFCGSLSLQAQARIGYINPQDVLEQLPETQAIERKLTEFIELKQAEFSVKEEAFLANVRRLQEQQQAQLISERELQRQREVLEAEQEELYVLLDSHQNELARRQQELLRPVLLSIDRAIAEVAAELQLDYVLNELTNEGDMILLFVSANGKNTLNITDRVLAKLK